MMRRFYALVPLLVALILPIGSWAVDWNYEFTVNGIKYSQNGNEREIRMELGGGAYNEVIAPEVEVIGLEDEAYAGELVIPEYVEYWLKDDKMGEAYLKSPVVGIAPSAFRRCSGLTSVVLPNSIEQIGEYSFASCTNLTSITFGNSLKTIGNHAFNVCKNLTSVYISDLAMWCNIKYGIDNDCDSHPLFSASEDKPTSLFLDGKEVRELIIPEDVTTIKDIAFIGCNRITSVKIPKSVTSIGALAFVNCNGLEKITTLIEQPFAIKATTFATFNMGSSEIINAILYVPVGTKAKYEATEGWKEFKNIVEMEPENKELKVGDTFTTDGITYQVTSIDPMEVQVGDGKHSVIDDVTPMDVDIPSTVTGPDSNVYTVKSIAKLAFFDCNEVTSIKLPSTIVSIGDQSFQACWKVPSITIPKSVTYIGFRAFAECSKLTEIYSQIEEPFALAEEAFRYKYINAETYYNRVTLYVPAGTKAKYEATDGWKEFKNIVEMAMLDPITGETTVNTEGLGNENLSDNVVNDIYYNVGSEGYDASDKSVVISQTTNMGQITDATPGSSEVKENFNGLILKVAAGKGTITVNVKTTGNAQLVVQVGNQTPMIASKTEQGDVVFSYDVTEDTYVYIYAIIGSSAARATRASSDNVVKIYGITVTPGATGITNALCGTSGTNHSYMLDGRKVVGQPTKKGVYIVNGQKIVVK